jgi:nucleotidyltransferase/DNA polymerase involved in DNA repair
MRIHAEHTASPRLSNSAAWRVAPPVDKLPKDRMLRELSGVPKGALRAVFGKELGKQIWEQVRRPRPVAGDAGAPQQPHTAARRGTLDVTDNELFAAMIESISRRAAETLAQHRRQANAIGLNLAYSDGSVRTESIRLARPSADAGDISAAAVHLFQRREPSDLLPISINLTTTTVQIEAILDAIVPIGCAVAASHA